MGLIRKSSDVGKYYMHSVSHSIGIDCHDATFAGDVLKPGWIISDEPGLYIDDEALGVRIEDDLLITEDGCEVLSRDIIKDPDEIETATGRRQERPRKSRFAATRRYHRINDGGRKMTSPIPMHPRNGSSFPGLIYTDRMFRHSQKGGNHHA